ncbi:hypothetical protein ACRAWF_08955 [Streptomyces sp. L7]
MAIEMDARGYAANSSSQLMTMATPPSAAMPARRHVMAPRSSPSPAQTPSSVSAPNTQRQNTTSATGWPGADNEPADRSGNDHGGGHLDRAARLYRSCEPP